MTFTFGSVCSGIGAPETAWRDLGWRCAFMSEIDAFPRAVLSHHFPEVPLHGDFTSIQVGDYASIDLLVGGTPCQSFSVAGLRGGMADERGNLALEYLRLADRLRPRWLVWENVPGVLSSNGGRDFGAFLGGLGELGYGFAYRSLDAQHFGLAQRRLRVFVVGYFGDWRPAAAVLFEPASLRGHPAPRREAGERVARPIAAGSPGGSGYRNDADTADSLIAHAIQAGALRENPDSGPDGVGVQADIAYTLEARAEVQAVAFGGNNTAGPIDVATALNASHTASGRQDFETETFIATTLRARDGAKGVDSDCTDTLIAHTLRGEGFDASEDGSGRGVPLVPMAFNSREDPCCTGAVTGALGSSSPQAQAVAFDLAQITSAANRTRAEPGLPASTLAKGSAMHVANTAAVRRLTPRECERLQGFPEITKSAIFRVCKNAAETHETAPSAGRSSVPRNQDQSAHAAVHVQIDLERQAVRILNQGRCIWSASNAAHPSSSPLSMPIDAFVRLVAHMTTNLVQVTHDGSEASPQSISGSIPRLSGSAFARVSGPEIAALVSDAARFTAAVDRCMKSTTSPVGPNSPNYAPTLATFGCCVAAAISSCIPEQTWAASSFDLSVETTEGFTAIPYRNGMAADGPRYRALGNSMAVPVMAWIGRRIAKVDADMQRAKEAI
jgi:DNA (cytosine-5)-methyltransferase 1